MDLALPVVCGFGISFSSIIEPGNDNANYWSTGRRHHPHSSVEASAWWSTTFMVKRLRKWPYGHRLDRFNICSLGCRSWLLLNNWQPSRFDHDIAPDVGVYFNLRRWSNAPNLSCHSSEGPLTQNHPSLNKLQIPQNILNLRDQKSIQDSSNLKREEHKRLLFESPDDLLYPMNCWIMIDLRKLHTRPDFTCGFLKP